MNLLAHAYLSFNDPALLTGNMISDYVKGRRQFDYPPGVQRGIRLHRAIDEFTDTHPATQEAKEIFRPVYRLYSGAFVDVVYDHFLANDRTIFSNETALNAFAHATYDSLQEQSQLLPPAFLRMLPYMRLQNWLYHYKDRGGIEKSLEGLVRRAAYLQESVMAYRLFNEHYAALQQHYTAFFPALQQFAAEQVQVL